MLKRPTLFVVFISLFSTLFLATASLTFLRFQKLIKLSYSRQFFHHIVDYALRSDYRRSVRLPSSDRHFFALPVLPPVLDDCCYLGCLRFGDYFHKPGHCQGHYEKGLDSDLVENSFNCRRKLVVHRLLETRQNDWEHTIYLLWQRSTECCTVTTCRPSA